MPREGAGHRLRADRHRPGGGVRLRRHAGLPRAARGGRQDRPGQLQPGDDHDRRGHGRRRLHRAADRRGASSGSSRASARTACCRRSAARPASTSPSRWPTPASSRSTTCACSARRSRRSAQAEDRELFKRAAAARSASRSPRARSSTTMEEAEALRERIGLPLVIRPAYTLGGTGGGIAHTDEEYRAASSRAASPPARSPGAGRALAARLERARVRGDARRRRHLHHHLQHGELRPDGRPHRRLASSSRPARR